MTQTLRTVLVSIALAAACSLAVAFIVLNGGRPPIVVAAPSLATSSFQPAIMTSGDATVSTKPDLASLFIGVDSQQSTASAAQTDLANKAAKLITRAKSLGIADADINTSGYSVGPYYTPGGQTINGYRAAEQLRLNWHDVGTAGKAVDALVQEGGATQVSVSFGLADPKAVQAQARVLAIADAHSRAEAMAGAAGAKLGQVIRISDLAVSGYPSANYAIGASAPAATQLPVGELNVTVTVEVDYAIG